jgi:hypothetical protein
MLDLRPVYHRLEPRIRAHVLLSWLALLLIRVAEPRPPPPQRLLPPRHVQRGDVRAQCTEAVMPARPALGRLAAQH